MMKHCKNCGKSLNDVFCSHCGQKTNVERISWKYIWHEVIHFFTHMEKGFLYTSRQLLFSPGKTVKEFIEGKRKNYQPPVSYFLIWIGLYLLLLYFTEKIFGENNVVDFKQYF